ncbi:iron complex transport system permease protein [bacterium A37T11]|nr:iron complex transport system permease protein [bacterium A37T11]
MIKPWLLYLLLSGGLFTALLLSLSIGALPIPPDQIWKIFCEKLGCDTGNGIHLQQAAILWSVRFPRTVLGLLVGASLGVAGAAIQGIFRNPLAEPGLIGISAGASLMAVLIIGLELTLFAGLSNLLGYYLLGIGAFCGAALSAFVVYHMSKSDGRPDVGTMLLAGIAINALAGSLTGLITYMADDQQLRNITFWMLGSLGGATWQTVSALLPFVLFPLLLLPRLGKSLNTFALGEMQSDHLGIDVNRIKTQVVILATMAVGASVAVSGIIGFVGLLVPHMVRLMAGVDNRTLVPASALLGALTLTLADLLCRTVIAPMELPIGVITSLLGTPVFLYILMKEKKKHSL